jgi:hypothetical protein
VGFIAMGSPYLFSIHIAQWLAHRRAGHRGGISLAMAKLYRPKSKECGSSVMGNLKDIG